MNLQDILFRAVTGVTTVPEVMTALLAKNGGVNGLDHDGSLLWHAVESSNQALCSALLARGADPNLKCATTQETISTYAFKTPYPLQLAATRNDTVFAVMLIAAGADTELRNDDGYNAEHIAYRAGKVEASRAIKHPLHAAADLNMPAQCAQLLELGFSPHEMNSAGQTPLELARLHVEQSDEGCARVIRTWIVREAALASVALCAKPGNAP